MEIKTGKASKRPYSFMLVAVSLDGKIAPRRRPGQPNPVGPSLIDPEIMKLHNQRRASADAIMVGLNCIRLDDSRLTLREGAARNPARIVLDGLAEMPPAAEPSLYGLWESNINVTTDDDPEKCDPLSGGWPFKGGYLRCRISKAGKGGESS